MSFDRMGGYGKSACVKVHSGRGGWAQRHRGNAYQAAGGTINTRLVGDMES